VRKTTLIRSAAILAAAGLMSACALLSSPDPIQMYRFGGAVQALPADPIASPVQVTLRRVEFPESTSGDRLLGVTGTETSYIGGARWVSPAADLYTESLEVAFAAQARRVRLIGPRELTRGDSSLDIDMRTFETRYDTPGGVPSVVIAARTRLMAMPERTVEAERTFTVVQPARANTVTAIVEAYDLATRDLNSQIVAWTDQAAGN
jgi:cholesterol transport system auxiliary component